jgi:hypothetical protein
MGIQIGPLSAADAAAGTRHCATESCGEPPVAELEARSFCLEHFVTQFVRDLQSRSDQLRSQPFDAAATESFKKLLADCAAQAKELLESDQNLALPGKERLLDILLLTSQLHQRLRRSPRAPKSVSVWLRREDPGQTWEEETWTSSISRHGAGLVCRHRVEPGRTVYLCRRDRGGRAKARVVYSHFDSAGDRQIGVEILDRVDFWDASELARPDVSTETRSTEVVAAAPAPVAAPATTSTTIHADVTFEIAGQTVEYKQIPLQLLNQGNEIHVSGTIPATLSDLKIDLASLAAKDAKSEAPVRISMIWVQEK